MPPLGPGPFAYFSRCLEDLHLSSSPRKFAICAWKQESSVATPVDAALGRCLGLIVDTIQGYDVLVVARRAACGRGRSEEECHGPS
jgi:hypothetical protein